MAVGTGTAILGSAAIGALAGGGKGGGSTTTMQSSEPWWGVQNYLRDLYSQANTQAGVPSMAQGLATQRALDPKSLTSQAQGQLGQTLSGRYLSPESNPFLRSSVQDALGLAGSAFAKQYGGPAGQNLGNSGYQEALARGLGAVATNAYSDAYGRERQNQLNAMQLAPALGFADINQLSSAEQMPWQRLQNYQQLLMGGGGGSSTAQTPYFTNPLANAMGMGLGGLGLFGAFNQGSSNAALVPEMVPGQYSLVNPQYGG